jgi:hypothetical protein
MHVDDRHRVVGGERLCAGQHLEQHDAQAVQVAARIELLAVPLLRAHVVRRAEDQPGIGDLELQRLVLGEPEINQRHLLIDPQHDVAGLEVAVQDARRMQRAERARDLRGEVQRFRGRDAARMRRRRSPCWKYSIAR